MWSLTGHLRKRSLLLPKCLGVVILNLLENNFLPVIDVLGATRRVSVKAALSLGSNVRAIHSSSPLAVIAAHRLLLAILQRVFGASTLEDRARWWQTGRFPPEALNAYFDRYRDRFNLFDLQRPFLQVADMTPEMSSRPWTALAAASASGNNKTLFDHGLDDAPAALDAHDAALVLLAAQATALGGGRSAFQYTSHAPSATASLVLVEGDNLFKTLLLNLIGQTVAQHQQDIAIWEREVPLRVEHMRSGPELAYRGIAQIYSLPARSIRLFSEGESGSVRMVGVASGERIDNKQGHDIDPMVAYRTDPERGLQSLSLDLAKDFWRDFVALRPKPDGDGWRPPQVVQQAIRLMRELRIDARPTLRVIGQANDKAKIEMWRDTRFALPRGLVADDDAWGSVQTALADAEIAGKELDAASFELACQLKSPGGKNVDRKSATALKQSFPMLGQYWSLLGREFPAWLARFDLLGDADSRERDWKCRVREALIDAWQQADHVVPRNYRGDRALIESDQRIRKHRRVLDLAIDPTPIDSGSKAA